MKTYKIALISTLFIINTFLFNQSNSVFSFSINIISLVTVLLLLLASEEKKKSQSSQLDKFENVEPLQLTLNVKKHSNLRLQLLELIQSIMKFEGIFYFEFDSKEKILKIKHALCKYAAVNTSMSFLPDDNYPGLFIRNQNELLCKDIREQESLSYYSTVEKKRKEILAIPFHINNCFDGVFIFDSIERDTFTEEIISVLKQFINILKLSYMNKTDEKENLSDIFYKSLSKLYEVGNTVYTEEDYYDLLKHVLSRLFNAKNFFIVRVVDKKRGELISVLGTIEGYQEKDIFLLSDGLIGWAIQNKKFIAIDRLIQNKQFTVRFSQDEKKPLLTNSLIFQAIYAEKTFGIGLESTKKNAFSSNDKKRLQELSPVLEKLFNETIKRQNLTQNCLRNSEEKNTFSLAAFKHHYTLFSTFKNRYNMNFTLFAIHVVNSKDLQESHRKIIFKFIILEVQKFVRNSDILFKYDNNNLILLLPFLSTEGVEAPIKLKVRLNNRLNSSRILIDNQYSTPTVEIIHLNDSTELSISDLFIKLNSLKHIKI